MFLIRMVIGVFVCISLLDLPQGLSTRMGPPQTLVFILVCERQSHEPLGSGKLRATPSFADEAPGAWAGKAGHSRGRAGTRPQDS